MPNYKPLRDDLIEEVSANIYRISVPLPLPQVKFVNAYAIIGKGKHLLVDPGMADPQCYKFMMAAVLKLGLDLKMTDFFITHHHLDHYSLADKLRCKNVTIYMNRKEFDAALDIVSGKALSNVAGLLQAMGFPEKNPMKVIPELFSKQYLAEESWPMSFIEDGDSIEIGEYSFKCIVTPGHSVAHTCLYEPRHKILIAGDALFQSIQYITVGSDPLARKLKSLEKLEKLDVKTVLPGHGGVYCNHIERINQLRRYHKNRLTKIKTTMEWKQIDAFRISEKTWDIPGYGQSWAKLMLQPKFFYTRETLVHLKYLEKNSSFA